MSTDKATPRPWRKILAPTQIIVDGKIIATLNKSGLTEEEYSANGKLIIQAVNSYDDSKDTEIAYKEACLHRKELLAENTKRGELIDELLRAAKMARQWLGASDDEGDLEVCTALDKAIAKAEGR